MLASSGKGYDKLEPIRRNTHIPNVYSLKPGLNEVMMSNGDGFG
jgi:hypothetical protein